MSSFPPLCLTQPDFGGARIGVATKIPDPSSMAQHGGGLEGPTMSANPTLKSCFVTFFEFLSWLGAVSVSPREWTPVAPRRSSSPT